MPAITIRSCDDWVAVYKDGHKVWENHSCTIEDGLRALGIEFERLDLDDQMDEDGLGSLKDGSDPFPEVLPGTQRMTSWERHGDYDG